MVPLMTVFQLKNLLKRRLNKIFMLNVIEKGYIGVLINGVK